MILDPSTGLTLEDAFELCRMLVRDNKDNLNELRDAIQADYAVPDDVIDSLENKEKLEPNDIRTLARAVGMDYELLTSKELAPDFSDRFNAAVNNMYNIRRRFRPVKQEVPDNGISEQ